MGHEGHDHDHGPHGHDHRHDEREHAHASGEAPGAQAHDHGEHGHPHHPRGHGHLHHHGSQAAKEHKSHAPAQVSAYVVTCSDSRSVATDESGRLIIAALERDGHSVAGHQVIRDEPAEIIRALERARDAGARALIVNGGTGIGRRDSTVETLQGVFEKTLPGFGELFRMLSFEEIGSPAMLSRATAGTWQGMIVFSLPGSPNAARLAMERLILPELGHAVRELTR